MVQWLAFGGLHLGDFGGFEEELVLSLSPGLGLVEEYDWVGGGGVESEWWRNGERLSLIHISEPTRPY